MSTAPRMMKSRLSFRLTAGACLAVFAMTGVRAQEAIVYDVELVVFEHLAPAGTPEDWALEERIARESQAVVTAEEEGSAVVPPSATDGSITVRQPLPVERLRLSAIAGALGRSRNYRTIAHFGWSQVGSPLNGAVLRPLDDLLPAGGPLTGSAALARGRFLHLTLDLAFQPEPSAPSYVLRQTRRMRSTERHYLDHPQFGVIALITPQGN